MLQFLTYLLHKQVIEMRCSQNLRCPFWYPVGDCATLIWHLGFFCHPPSICANSPRYTIYNLCFKDCILRPFLLSPTLFQIWFSCPLASRHGVRVLYHICHCSLCHVCGHWILIWNDLLSFHGRSWWLVCFP